MNQRETEDIKTRFISNEALLSWGLVGLFIFSRIFILLFSHPLNLFIFRGEELYRGGMALILQSEGPAALYRFRPDDYAGGSFIMSLIISLFFRVLPTTAFTLKLVSVTWSGLALAFWYRVIARFDSLKTAVIFALIFILSPPAFLRYTLAPLGDHSETILFIGVELLLLFEIIYGQKKNPILPCLLGATAGFGIWFAYIHVFFVMTMLLFWGYANPRFFRSRAFCFFLFFLGIGFSPWILLNLKHHGIGLVVQGKPIWESIHIKFFVKRILDLRTSTLYELFSYYDISDLPSIPFGGTLWFYRAFYIIPIGSLVWKALSKKKDFFWNKEKPLVMIAALYLFLFCTLAQCTGYEAIRYFIPTNPFIFYLQAFSIHYFSRNEPKRLYTFLILLVSGAFFFQGRLLSFSDMGYALRVPGFSFSWLTGSPVCANPKNCLDAYLHLKKRFPKIETQTALQDLFLALASDIPSENLQSELDQIEQQIPKHLYPSFYFAMGYEIYAKNHQNFLESLNAAAVLIKPRSELYFKLTTFGLIRAALTNIHPQPVEEMLRLQPNIPDFALSEYWRQRGQEWLQSFALSKQTSRPFDKEIIPFRQKLPKTAFDFFFQGLGECTYGYWSVNRTSLISPMDFSHFSEQERINFIKGAGSESSKPYDADKAVLRKMFLKKAGFEYQKIFDESAIKKNRQPPELALVFN